MSVRIAFGLILIIATGLLYVPKIESLLRHRSAVRWLQWIFLGSRAMGWLMTYVVLGALAQSSDLALYYYPEAELAFSGQFPYVDFDTSYGPLFPYVAGLFLPITNDAAAVAFSMIGSEVAAVLLFVNIAQQRVEHETTARALFVYILNPAALYWSGMTAYNSSLILFFWILAIGLLLSDRYALSLIAIAASVLAAKFLGVLATPVWFADPRRRNSTVVGLATAAIAITLWARAWGVDFLLPLLREGNRSTPGNVWFLLSGAFAFSSDGPLWKYGPLTTVGLATASLSVWLWRRWHGAAPRIEQLCGAVAAIGWLFMLLSKKSYPHYVPMFLLLGVLALSASLPRRRGWAIQLAAGGAVGIVEPRIWNALGQPQMLHEAADPATAAYYLLILFDTALIATHMWCFVNCARFSGSGPIAAGPGPIGTGPDPQRT